MLTNAIPNKMHNPVQNVPDQVSNTRKHKPSRQAHRTPIFCSKRAITRARPVSCLTGSFCRPMIQCSA